MASPTRPRKKLLLVDDEVSFLLSVQDGLASLGDRIEIHTANNGLEALEILGSNHIDLVVTDLKMPKLDGFQLLATMASRHRSIPVIIMTAYGTPKIESQLKRLGTFGYLEKPLDLQSLKAKILAELDAGRRGFIASISLPSLLQLVELERKTCTLRVRDELGTDGFLFFRQGLLIAAESNDHRDELAARELLVLENVEIDIDNVCRFEGKQFSLSVTGLLMDCMRLKDEGNEMGEPLETENTSLDSSIDDSRQSTHDNNNKLEDSMSDMKQHLESFNEIEGFRGAAVFTPQGEMVAGVSNGQIDIKSVGMFANNALLNAQKATDKMGVGRGNLVQIRAPQATLFMRCLNEATDFAATAEGKAHFHMIVVLDPDGNAGMTTMILDKVVAKIADEVR